MIENEYNSMHHSTKPKNFDEGVHLDTGEIDPDTGERIIDNPNQYPDIHAIDKESTGVLQNKETKVCQFCGQDPCSTDCIYR